MEQCTDVVITLNIPHFIYETQDQTSTGTMCGAIQEETEQEAGYIYHKVVTSFEIKDWDLFNGK